MTQAPRAWHCPTSLSRRRHPRPFRRLGRGRAITAALKTFRVDSISRTSSTTAEVVYSILLNDQVVFDGRIGEAVLTEGRWFVSKATFCDLVALSPGAEEVTVG